MGIWCQMAQESQTGAPYQSKGWDGEGNAWEFQKGGDICTPMADSSWGLTEKRKFCKAIILQ